jgi:hypothetical protein
MRLDTWYRRQDRHGNSIACLSLRLDTANTEFRDKVYKAIRDALADPPPEKQEKNSSIGFQMGQE